MKERNPYQPNTKEFADQIADLWQGIASDLKSITTHQKEISVKQGNIQRAFEQLRELLPQSENQEAGRGADTLSRKQKFGWNPAYKIEELYSRVNGILIDTIPFEDFRLAFTDDEEPIIQIKIQNRRVKQFVDLIFHLNRKEITLNTSLGKIIHDRCLDSKGEIKTHNIEEYISLVRKDFTDSDNPLYESTANTLLRLEKTKLSSD